MTLKGVHPPIWRRIQVPGELTLPQLHAVLQIAMGWTNSHLHGFRVGEQFFTEPDPDYAGKNVMDERQIRLSQIASEVSARFVYEYDFGDRWEHAGVVEQILPPETGVAYPRCSDGNRACPPENVGGVPGYMEFLAAIQNHGILSMPNGFSGLVIRSIQKRLTFQRSMSFSRPSTRI